MSEPIKLTITDPVHTKDYKVTLTPNAYEVNLEVEHLDDVYEIVIEVFDKELIIRHYRKGTDEPLGVDRVTSDSRGEGEGEKSSAPDSSNPEEPTYLDL